MNGLTVEAVAGIGEITATSDLAAEIAAATDLADGDVLVVTSKVVSKAEGRVVRGRPKDEVLADETDRVVARRGGTSIVRTRHGLVMAAAGIDASNTEPGSLVLLPRDPDESARRLRERLAERLDLDVAVVVSDTSGRAWRTGQTDIAVGVAGLDPLHELAGRQDSYGNDLAVTAPALADEIAGAGDLVKGKLGGFPVAVVRGLAALVLPRGEHGPGARALLRGESGDMFGLGAREAVMSALAPAPDLRGFGAAAATSEIVPALEAVLGGSVRVTLAGGDVVVTGSPGAVEDSVRVLTRAVCHAHAWTVAPDDASGILVCRPTTPAGP